MPHSSSPRHPWLRVACTLLALGFLSTGAGWSQQPEASPSNPDKIVAGAETTKWHAVGALVQLPGRRTGCTATLIGCRLALTAAHCLCATEGCTASGPLVPASSLLVAFQRGPTVGVSSYVVHPTFSDATQVDDIAVLHLDAPVTGIQPAPLNNVQPPPLGSRGTALGYGVTGFTNDSSAGLKRVGNYSSVACDQFGVPNATNLCFFFAPGDSGTCFGDSGGPDFFDFGSGPVLSGVHTAVTDCSPGAFTYSQDVFSYRSFIAANGGATLGKACSGLPLLGSERAELDSFSGAIGGTPVVRAFIVPPNTDVVRFGLNSNEPIDNDLDLTVRHAQAPTATEFDCRSAHRGSFEFCEISNPDPGLWIARVERQSGPGVRSQLTASSFLAATVPAPPQAPSDLQASAQSFSEILLQWQDNASNETGFSVERRSGGSPFQKISALQANTTQLLDGNLAPDTSYEYRVRASNGDGSSAFSNVAQARTPSLVIEPCVASDETLCLNQDRFRVEVTWLDFQGNTGVGRVVPGASDDSGLLYFFRPANWEMLIKVLDGCALNQHYWVFAAATTNVQYTLTVTDSMTGISRKYTNPLGTSAQALTDTSAFSTCP